MLDYSVGGLADVVTGGDEVAMRKLLKDAGADIDELATDRSERVPREVVIDVAAVRAGDRVGRILAEVLGEE